MKQIPLLTLYLQLSNLSEDDDTYLTKTGFYTTLAYTFHEHKGTEPCKLLGISEKELNTFLDTTFPHNSPVPMEKVLTNLNKLLVSDECTILKVSSPYMPHRIKLLIEYLDSKPDEVFNTLRSSDYYPNNALVLQDIANQVPAFQELDIQSLPLSWSTTSMMPLACFFRTSIPKLLTCLTNTSSRGNLATYSKISKALKDVYVEPKLEVSEVRYTAEL